MGAADFRAEVRRRRDLQRLSRTALAQLSGLSAALIEKLERRDSPTQPKRTTVIDLARALNWEIDEALRLVGYDALTDDERAELAKTSNPRERLDRVWDELRLLSSGRVAARLRDQTVAPIVDAGRP